MPKYLFRSSYTEKGLKGLLADGGSKRRAAAAASAKSAGGELEAFYFAFGDTDVYIIADLPDNEAAAAVAMTVTSSGAVRISTTVLMTPEEMDSAAKKAVSYSPPGG